MALAFTMKACTQVLLQPTGFDAARFLATIARERVTHTWLVPTQVKMVLDHPGLDDANLSTLQTIVYGGAPMHVEHLKEAIRRIGPVFVQLFAQTESPMITTGPSQMSWLAWSPCVRSRRPLSANARYASWNAPGSGPRQSMIAVRSRLLASLIMPVR